MMTDINYFTPFSDWLSISYSSQNSPYTSILAFLNKINLETKEISKGSEKTLYQCSSGGSLFVTHKLEYHNFSFSGALLQVIRDNEALRDFLLLLGASPYNITRLDVAYDLPLEGSLAIDNIEKAYPTGRAYICSHPRTLQYVLGYNYTGKVKTGTVYFQNSKYKGNVKLRAYDKTKEVLDRTDYLIPPTFRYEFTICRGASLRDFSDPTCVFWHYMPENLLKRPTGDLIDTWKPIDRIEYDKVAKQSPTDFETLRYLIQNSIALRNLIEQASLVNGGASLLHREIDSTVSAMNSSIEISEGNGSELTSGNSLSSILP